MWSLPMPRIAISFGVDGEWEAQVVRIWGVRTTRVVMAMEAGRRRERIMEGEAGVEGCSV